MNGSEEIKVRKMKVIQVGSRKLRTDLALLKGDSQGTMRRREVDGEARQI